MIPDGTHLPTDEDFEEAKSLLESGDKDALAAFASRDVDERAARAAAAARADKSETQVRFEHGWLTDAGYICDGCNVREGHEHRCHGDDGDGPTPCACPECMVECSGCGREANERLTDGWYFGSPHPSDGLPVIHCPECRA